MIEQRLLAVANDLCRRTGRRPREAFMRRAASTAYYAVCHALSRMCADELVGGAHAKTAAWGRVYRGVDHRAAKQMLLSKDAGSISPAVVKFGRTFASLQEVRHRADYDPVFFDYFFEDTAALVEDARTAIDDLNGLRAEDRRAVATLVLFRPRGGAPSA